MQIFFFGLALCLPTAFVFVIAAICQRARMRPRSRRY
jgi:hypothetical protein